MGGGLPEILEMYILENILGPFIYNLAVSAVFFSGWGGRVRIPDIVSKVFLGGAN